MGTNADKTGHAAPEPEDTLPPAQEKALTALLASVTIEAAAKKAGMSARTVRRYLEEPEFRRAYLAARRAGLEQATGALQQAAHGAVAALVKNLSCGAPSVEVTAARSILDYGLKGLELLELEARLAAVEESLAAPVGKGEPTHGLSISA